MTKSIKKISVKEIVDLWHETQLGHYKKCQEKQFEFANVMWVLYEDFHSEDEE